MKKLILLIVTIMATESAIYAQQPAQLIVVDEAKNETDRTAIAVSQSILEGNWAKLDSLLDEQFTYTGDGYHFTKDQYIGFMQDMRAAFSNFEMILEKTIVDSNFASIRFTSKVVNTGKFMGAPANNKNLVVTGIFMRKIENGKVMQEWQTTDLLGTMSQIGFGATLGYSIFVTGFKVKQVPPQRKPNDFLHINGAVVNYDTLSAKEKNKYVKKYMKGLK
jgi:predicted ester cyclase